MCRLDLLCYIYQKGGGLRVGQGLLPFLKRLVIRIVWSGVLGEGQENVPYK